MKYLDRRIPRYTSYPTAMQFSSEVNARTYECWLGAVPATAPISIYIHVPFCAVLCLYCGCHTTVARRYRPIEAYVNFLKQEIDLVSGILGVRNASHLHWGGGTPTTLSPQDFIEVMAAVRKNFILSPQAELAIEIDPRTLTRGHVSTLADAGITRASLGVQDFEERVQRAIGRVQSFEQTARAVEWLRNAGFTSINLDLMYGLPYQTVATVAATAQRALALDPDRIALFGYAHVPWMKRHQQLIPTDALPGGADRFAQNRAAAEVLTRADYRPIGLDHFAKSNDPLAQREHEGRLHRNFQGYTTDETSVLIGLGPSAISSLPNGYVQNAPNMVVYRTAIASGHFATGRGCALTKEDRIRRNIIERLMCDLYVDLNEICAAYNTNPDNFAVELSKLDELANDGIVERTGGRITVPEHARPFVRTVCTVFDAYLANDQARFSHAS